VGCGPRGQTRQREFELNELVGEVRKQQAQIDTGRELIEKARSNTRPT
jgi:hypothetical protein